MLLNNYFSAVWCIMMLTEKDETDPEVYFWYYIDQSCEMHRRLVDQFGFGEI